MSFIDKIDAYCKEYRISHTCFEHKAGLAKGIISKWSNKGAIPTYRSQQKVAAVIGITVADLMREDSYDFVCIADGCGAAQMPGPDIVRDAAVRYIPLMHFSSHINDPDDAAVTGHIAILPGTLEEPERCFAYMIEDSGMAADMEPGDIVIVRRDSAPVSGDIVIAEVPDGVLCRKYVQDGRSIILQPFNRHYNAAAYISQENEMPPVKFDGVVIKTIKDIPSSSFSMME